MKTTAAAAAAAAAELFGMHLVSQISTSCWLLTTFLVPFLLPWVEGCFDYPSLFLWLLLQASKMWGSGKNVNGTCDCQWHGLRPWDCQVRDLGCQFRTSLKHQLEKQILRTVMFILYCEAFGSKGLPAPHVPALYAYLRCSLLSLLVIMTRWSTNWHRWIWCSSQAGGLLTPWLVSLYDITMIWMPGGQLETPLIELLITLTLAI